jgi:hypothetical protein
MPTIHAPPAVPLEAPTLAPAISPTGTDAEASPASAQALDLLQAELLALDPDDLLPVNLDVGAAALVVIGAAPKIRSYRAELVALCGEEMTSTVDRLELVARAALQAHAMRRSIESATEVQTLSAELAEIREVLLTEARALIARKALPRGALQELSGMHGFKNQCLDVLQLVSALKTHWELVRRSTGLTRAYFDQAEAAANALATAIGKRSQLARSPAADLRQRAYTLMARVYDQARRMIAFLRWNQGDAERIAPSLYRARSSTRRRRAGANTTAAVPPVTNDVAAPGPFTER